MVTATKAASSLLEGGRLGRFVPFLAQVLASDRTCQRVKNHRSGTEQSDALPAARNEGPSAGSNAFHQPPPPSEAELATHTIRPLQQYNTEENFGEKIA